MRSAHRLYAALIALLMCAVCVSPGFARGHHSYSYHYHSYHSRSHHSRSHHGRHRSLEAKHQFWDMTGHPHGWPGHVVDHKIPLACGGADAPGNMQWQTIAEGKAKDKWERRGCTRHH